MGSIKGGGISWLAEEPLAFKEDSAPQSKILRVVVVVVVVIVVTKLNFRLHKMRGILFLTKALLAS